MHRIEARAAEIASVFRGARDRVAWAVALHLAAEQLRSAAAVRGSRPTALHELGLQGHDGLPEPRTCRAHVEEPSA